MAKAQPSNLSLANHIYYFNTLNRSPRRVKGPEALIVDEMEAAGHYPRLAHPLEAKKRMGKTGKKTDNVDANGLGILLRNGTLPEVC
jgi:hypothetical protein